MPAELTNTDDGHHYVDVRSTDPWEVALRLVREGETLALVVDEELSVIDRLRA